MEISKKLKLNICRLLFLLFLAACTTMTSCISPKRILYFQDFPDTASVPFAIKAATPFVDPVIESNDNLAVSIRTIIPGSQTPIAPTESSFSPISGFLVDKDGYIELPLVGFVKVGGLTTTEARELLKQKAKEFFKDPVVSVRISNFEITILGAGRVGTVNAINEKISIVDALALSGGLPLDARHDNILLIRRKPGESTIIRYNIRTSKIFQSPYFYLKQHDIIYVEPTKYKIQSSDNSFARTVGIVSTVFSLVSLYYIVKSLK